METRFFGPIGVRVPVIGQGTWEMELGDRAQAVRALRRGIDLGMTHIDTAEMYGSGCVEEIVGEAIRGLRSKVFLASKVLPSNATGEGTLRACEESLRRLDSDFLDLYLLHWNGGVRLEETFRAFDKLVRDGKVRFWGVSNFDPGELKAAIGIAGDGKIACNQVLYHLEERTIEHELIPLCEIHRVAVVAYSPLAQKRFQSRPALDEIARDRGVTPAQVALAFLTRSSSIFAISKALRLEHVEENAAAAALRLTDDETRWIDRAFPLGPCQGLATA